MSHDRMRKIFDEIGTVMPDTLINIMAQYTETPAQYVVRIADQPHQIATLCYDLFKSQNQNGVSCALNLLEEKQRDTVLDYFYKTNLLLAIYFSTSSEIQIKFNLDREEENQFLQKQYKEIDEQVKTFIRDNSPPSALIHAVKIKLKLSQVWSTDELEKEIQKLITESSLHLSFRGVSLVGLELSGLDLSTLDFTKVMMAHSEISKCNLAKTDFTNAEFIRALSFYLNNLMDANVKNVTLGNYSNLNEIIYIQGCDFTNAELTIFKTEGETNVMWECSDLRSAKLSEQFQEQLRDNLVKVNLKETYEKFPKNKFPNNYDWAHLMVKFMDLLPKGTKIPADDVLFMIWMKPKIRLTQDYTVVEEAISSEFQNRLNTLSQEDLQKLSPQLLHAIEAFKFSMKPAVERYMTYGRNFMGLFASMIGFDEESSSQDKKNDVPDVTKQPRDNKRP